jgi:oxygen-independent coproporphyrinogen III oxidase
MTHDTFSLPLRQRQTATSAGFLRPAPGHPPEPVRSLYIHIPFCFHKCHYCDFYSLVDTRDRQEPFLERLIRELAAQAPLAAGAPLRTIFVGGGTPSLLRPDLWSRLLTLLGELFDLSLIRSGHEGGGEFTVECNPETVSPELMAILAAGGVNRVSVGAQSFNPAHLKALERWHNPENVPKALDLARAAGIPRRSLDLIFGIPGQTIDDWAADLDTALACGTTHLSCYNLTYEPQTALTARLKRGDFKPAEEDLEVEMYQHTLARLRVAGLDRYEVSNYAIPGDESRHNLAYWRQHQWLAAGPSASGHIAGNRWKNVARLDDYLNFDEDGFAPIIDHEPPDPARALSESIMTGLRLAEGLDSNDLIRRAAAISRPRLEVPARLLRKAFEHESRGHMRLTDARWSLTDEGFLIADTIAGDLMACLP